MTAAPLPKVGFVLEQSLGHVTHGDNLRRLVPELGIVDARFVDIPYAVEGWQARVPGFASNWSVRAGVRSIGAIRALRREGVDALFIHTQTAAVLATPWFRSIPTVVSLDATPLQYDELGASYQHSRSPGAVEALKLRMNRSCFAAAAHVVCWSRWAQDGLVEEYSVAEDAVTVIPPGVDSKRWRREGERTIDDVVRILFVGADLERKGGATLLAAFQKVREELGPTVQSELHLVTKSSVDAGDGVVVHGGLGPNSTELIDLYHRCDVFALPTRGDCLPMVLSEAGAAGLPLVSTDVGAIREIVRDGETGRLVPVDDVAALTAALLGLARDRSLRERMGRAASALVTEQFDAEKNARLLAGLLRSVAEARADNP